MANVKTSVQHITCLLRSIIRYMLRPCRGHVEAIPRLCTSTYTKKQSITINTLTSPYRPILHCATSQKVVGSIPDGVIGIFHWYNPTGRTIALGLTRPLTEMSTRNISWGGKDGRCLGMTTLQRSCADCLEIWKPQPSGTLRACPGLWWNFFNLFI
jgi:hypothetical protein